MLWLLPPHGFYNMQAPWKISLHGGHSSAYCDHAHSTLREMIDRAVDFGYHTFGITEHAPRVEPHRIFAEEAEMGWDVAHLEKIFGHYAAETCVLTGDYAGRIHLLRGFEAEVVPESRYADLMLGYLQRFSFDYLVGSVHWVNGHIIDYKQEDFEKALAMSGSLEKLAADYYAAVRDMTLRLRPQVVGHFDLIRRSAPDEASVSSPVARRAAMDALEAVRETGAILDVNTAGYRKGLGRPYPAPWIVEAARDLDIPFCFGDDSHRADEVGAGLAEARNYLLDLGIKSLLGLSRGTAGVERLEYGLY